MPGRGTEIWFLKENQGQHNITGQHIDWYIDDVMVANTV